jgi:uncharacterized membrane protein
MGTLIYTIIGVAFIGGFYFSVEGLHLLFTTSGCRLMRLSEIILGVLFFLLCYFLINSLL